MSETPERQQAEELVRIVTAAVRECWQAYRLQFPDGKPSPGAIEAILARSAYPILAKIEAAPPDLQPILFASVVRAMLVTFVQITQGELTREHRQMLDTLEREASKFADRGGR